MEEFTVKSTSPSSALVMEDFVLGTTETTRKVFRAEIVRKPGSDECMIKGCLIHQRKKAKDVWEDVKEVKLSELRAGEGVAFPLDSTHVKVLIESLDKLKAIAVQHGIKFKRSKLVVADKDSVIEVSDHNRKQLIQQLLGRNYGQEFWQALNVTLPDLGKALAYSRIQMDRERALDEFQDHMTRQDWKESDWEDFFFRNQWVFGYGLNYQFLGIVQRQANYGGASYRRTGEQKGEFLMRTVGQERFTVLVEIKRPDTRLYEPGKFYRNGVPSMSSNLIGAISQAQVNGRTWDIEGSRRDSDREALEIEHTNTITPLSIVVIGHTRELETKVMKQAFEVFRRNLRNPDIITFDELYERAKYIVDRGTEAPETSVDAEDEITDEEVPF